MIEAAHKVADEWLDGERPGLPDLPSASSGAWVCVCVWGRTHFDSGPSAGCTAGDDAVCCPGAWSGFTFEVAKRDLATFMHADTLESMHLDDDRTIGYGSRPAAGPA
jgi:hypothetical protein